MDYGGLNCTVSAELNVAHELQLDLNMQVNMQYCKAAFLIYWILECAVNDLKMYSTVDLNA